MDVLKKYISDNADQKNIVFLWDYVYHFSYDRSALLSLYTLFLELFSQWKNVYILAWNHDWIGSTFVFEEAKRTYEIITNNFVSNDKWGKIEFITKPKVENIEWEDILFLPYFLEEWRINSEDWRMKSEESKNVKELEIENVIKILSESKKKNEIVSAKVNQILLDYIQKYPKLTIIHHYYIEWINFPWQRGRFYFNDIAISKLFCELPNIKMISGHLHQWFVYKNYLCTGSVRNTSPLEVNHIKMLFKYSNNVAKWNMIFINPYLLIENWWLIIDNGSKDVAKINEKFVDEFVLNTIDENKQNYQWSDIWDVDFDSQYKIENKDISISMKVEDLNYDEINKYIDEDLFKKLKDVKLKKNLKVTKDLFEKMDIEGKNLTQWFSDWKWLLKDYLTNKYPEDFDKYLDFLRKEKIV